MLAMVIQGNPGRLTGLALAPENGLMFWSDLNGEVETIKISNMDGTKPREIKTFARYVVKKLPESKLVYYKIFNYKIDQARKTEQ